MFARSIVDDMQDMRHSFDQRHMTGHGDTRTALGTGDGAFAPPVETGWTDQAYHLRFIIPGVPERHLRTTVQGNQLLVTGERQVPDALANQDRADLCLAYRRFAKLIDLPTGLNVAKLSARLRDGILHVTIPITDPVAPRRVMVEAVMPEEWALATV